MKEPKLTIELVPETAWGSNLRLVLSVKDWDVLRRACYEKAGFVCEICGGKGSNHSVEAHEVWEYNDKTHVQKLLRLIALCPSCHEVKHFGRAEAIGNRPRALMNLMQVNNWSRAYAESYIAQVYELWNARSNFMWTLDTSVIGNLKLQKELPYDKTATVAT